MRWGRLRFVVLIVLLVSVSIGSGGVGFVSADHAPGTSVYVDDDCDDPGDGTVADPFCTIQEAVSHANPGDTIQVADGTYIEAGQIVVNKNLSIVGAGTSDTVILTDRDTGSSGDSRGWFLVGSGVEFFLADLTLDGSGFRIWQAIRHRGTGSIDGVRITSIKFQESGSPYAGTGVAAFGTGTVDVSDSAFDEIGRIAVQYFGTGASGSTVSDSTFAGKGDGDWLDYAVEVGAGAQVSILDNEISGNRGVASSDGSTSAGVLVTTFFGGGSTATIEGNDFSGNTTAIAVGFNGADTSQVQAHQNNIAGNDNGIVTTAPIVDATCNWWGDASGPENASSNPDGSGDSAGDDVVVEPWLIEPAPSDRCIGPIGPEDDPETVEDCKNGGWEAYGFRNQGQCIRFVKTGFDSRS